MSEFKLNYDEDLFKKVKYDDNGLVPGVVQDLGTGEVLMVAWLNEESLKKTIESGNATFWSRSRKKLWMKGESSGNVIKLQHILIDCDGDTLVLLGYPEGPTCHTGERTCFYRLLADNPEELEDPNPCECDCGCEDH